MGLRGPKVKQKKKISSTVWKKGQSGNPGGLPVGAVPKKEFRLHTKATVAEAFSKVCDCNKYELEEIINSGTNPAIEILVAKALLNDIKAGSLHNLNNVLERIIGKIPVETKSEFTGKDGSPLPVSNSLPQIIFNGVTPTSELKEGEPKSA